MLTCVEIVSVEMHAVSNMSRGRKDQTQKPAPIYAHVDAARVVVQGDEVRAGTLNVTLRQSVGLPVAARRQCSEKMEIITVSAVLHA